MSSPAPTTTLPSAPPTGELRRLRFPALGTTCEVQYVPTGDATHALRFEAAVKTWVETFEARYSRFRPDSVVSRINAAAGGDWVGVDDETETLLQLCDLVYTMTRGILDPTVLPLLRLWNWKAAPQTLPGAADIAAARQLVGWNKVQRRARGIRLPVAGMALDFGGFGKEYAVDLVAQLALDYGITSALIDFGHDIRALGIPPGRPAWHIGLENPRSPGEVSGSLAIEGSRGVASSGDYVRKCEIGGKRYGHILDPRTGWPVANECLQATVVAGTCLQAGVLSTAAFVLGAAEGTKFIDSFPTAAGLVVTETARAQTRGFYRYVAH